MNDQDREALIAEVKRLGNLNLVHYGDLIRRLADALAEAHPREPEGKGWKLVPVEPTEEMLRASLAIDWPATYREFLRHPANGSQTAAENEERIVKEFRRYAAVLAAAPQPRAKP